MKAIAKLFSVASSMLLKCCENAGGISSLDLPPVQL
jgi:hypothetical protein